jgi:hypothetical protein
MMLTLAADNAFERSAPALSIVLRRSSLSI